jgi:site-specific recombinase XerD
LFFFRFVDLHPEEISQSDVLRFRYEMESQAYSETTINQCLAAVSSFFTAAVEQGLRAANPAEGVKRKAVNPYGKSTFLEEEQDLNLLKSVDRSTPKASAIMPFS